MKDVYLAYGFLLLMSIIAVVYFTESPFVSIVSFGIGILIVALYYYEKRNDKMENIDDLDELEDIEEEFEDEKNAGLG